MFEFVLLFIGSQLALLARYIVFEKFEPLTYASTFLFLAAAVFVYFVSKAFAKKELAYVPKQIDDWSFLNKQRARPIAKPLYKGEVLRGSVERFFHKKWQYVIADIFSASFFLALRITIDGDVFELRPQKTKLLSQQGAWLVLKNGQQIGQARTVIDLKNTLKLKEVIEMTIGDTTYTSAASTVTSGITLLHNETKLGDMKRHHLISNVHVLTTADDTPEQLLPLLLHAYYFKQA